MQTKVIFFDEHGNPVPMQFDGESAEFFNQLRRDFTDLNNMEAVGVVYGAALRRKDGQVLSTGGITGDPESVVKLVVNIILQYAGMLKRPIRLTIADIADIALHAARSSEQTAQTTTSGLIIPGRKDGA